VFTEEPNGALPKIDPVEIKEPWTEINISQTDALKKLKNLNGNKSMGPDKIHPRVLKELAEELSLPFSILFNKSLKSMELPSDWKCANITALFKKGSKKAAGNYRPVSLTSVVVKMLESLVRDYIMKNMQANNLFSKFQFGFMSGRSTTLQLLHVLENWTKTMDEGGTVDCIYLDFAKAFDKVPHRRLLLKLKNFGISDPVLGWIEAFLSDRSQRVTINGTSSQWKPVTSGVPQGSVLGPVLFAMYINDLPEAVGDDCLAYMFADDTKLFKDIESGADVVKLQNGLSNFQLWARKWLMEANVAKCKSMSVGEKQPGSHVY